MLCELKGMRLDCKKVLSKLVLLSCMHRTRDFAKKTNHHLGPCLTIRIWTRSVPKFMSWYFLATSVTNSWHFLTLLDDSWTVGRTKNFWKFVEHVQKICDSLTSLARSWTLLDNVSAASWWFLNYSWLDLAVLGESVNEKELVKNSQEESRSCQDALKKLTRTCNEILAAWQGAVEMLSRCDETSPRSIKKYQEGVAIPFQDAPDISGQHGNRPVQ